MTILGSIGIGLLVLIIVWILTLGIFVVAVKLQSNISWIALGTAAIITIVIVSIPIEKHHKQYKTEPENSDYLIIYRSLLLSFLSLSVIIGFVLFFLLHCIEPVRASPIKRFS